MMAVQSLIKAVHLMDTRPGEAALRGLLDTASKTTAALEQVPQVMLPDAWIKTAVGQLPCHLSASKMLISCLGVFRQFQLVLQYLPAQL